MAAPSATPKHGGGIWVLNPGDLSDPFGTGTQLGLTQETAFSSEELWEPIVAPEFGGVEVDRIFLGYSARLEITVANWDQAIVGTYWPGVTVGTAGPIVPFTHSSLAPGTLQSTLGVTLVHVARHAADPTVRIFNAVPMGSLSGFVMQDGKPAKFRAVFDCLLDSSKQVAKIAALADQG